MSLLFPGFLLGLAAIAIPILLHLRRQPPKETLTFSSLMFLEKTPVRPRTRRRLEDWLLLLLRCLALALLAFMFARPFARTPIAGEKAGAAATIVLLDRSASMRGDVWKDALAKASEIVAGLSESDAAALVTFDGTAQTALSFDAWSSTAAGQRRSVMRAEIEKLQPGWGSTNLGGALVSSVAALSDRRATTKKIVLVSDMQEGAALSALDGFTWPEEVTVSVVRLIHASTDNLTLSASAKLDDNAEAPTKARADAALRIRVSNAAGSRLSQFSVAWRGESGAKTEGTLAAGNGRVMAAPPRTKPDQDGVLDLSGDSIDFDNHLYVARAHPRKAEILCVGKALSRSDTASPLFYLARALQPNALVEPNLTVKEPADLSAAALAVADFVVISGDLPEKGATALRDWVSSGHHAVCLVQEGADKAALSALTGLPIAVAESKPANYAMLGDLEFDHPILAPFAEAGIRDFTKIRFWKHRQLQVPDAAAAKMEILARFDDGTPAWGLVPLGKGWLLLMASGWQPSDSQLAVSSKFVPLVYAILDHAGLASPESHPFMVGDAIPVKEWNAAGPVNVACPDGRSVSWDGAKQGPFTGTITPGIYTFGAGSSATSVAVNVAPSEGRLTPMDAQKLRDLGVRMSDAGRRAMSDEDAAKEALQLADNEREQRQRIWRWLALAAVVVLLAETWLAGRRERQPAVEAVS